ncbi:unnamed protein product [Clavelina lepadiformis]|uniref:Uncharacterized protein n=1 Tax=Clavelina lepadiformis TaxID=159417 RepID=A0ABP0F2H1_CLALP
MPATDQARKNGTYLRDLRNAGQVKSRCIWCNLQSVMTTKPMGSLFRRCTKHSLENSQGCSCHAFYYGALNRFISLLQPQRSFSLSAL